MSVTGTGPVNSGSPFKPLQTPFKITGNAASALHDKISQALSDQQNQFAEMEATELKKRVAFYERFGGKVGDDGLNAVASQTGQLISRLMAGGKGIVV